METVYHDNNRISHFNHNFCGCYNNHTGSDKILALDPAGLYEVVREEDISMCGYGPAVAMLTAVKDLGATRAELVRYGTSADTSGDYSAVVGYAGRVIS